jgi:hypothetical protein
MLIFTYNSSLDSPPLAPWAPRPVFLLVSCSCCSRGPPVLFISCFFCSRGPLASKQTIKSVPSLASLSALPISHPFTNTFTVMLIFTYNSSLDSPPLAPWAPRPVFLLVSCPPTVLFVSCFFCSRGPLASKQTIKNVPPGPPARACCITRSCCVSGSCRLSGPCRLSSLRTTSYRHFPKQHH